MCKLEGKHKSDKKGFPPTGAPRRPKYTVYTQMGSHIKWVEEQCRFTTISTSSTPPTTGTRDKMVGRRRQRIIILKGAVQYIVEEVAVVERATTDPDHVEVMSNLVDSEPRNAQGHVRLIAIARKLRSTAGDVYSNVLCLLQNVMCKSKWYSQGRGVLRV